MTLEHIDILLAHQRRAVRWYASFAGFWVAVGVSILVVGWFFGGKIAGEELKAILGIGAALFTSGSLFPAKEVLGCRDRLDLYLHLRRSLQGAEPGDVERVRALVWDVLKKSAGA